MFETLIMMVVMFAIIGAMAMSKDQNRNDFKNKNESKTGKLLVISGGKIDD